MKTKRQTPKGEITMKGNGGKRSATSVKFSCMGPIESDPVIEEIPGNEVNVATRQINLANTLGVGGWGSKKWAEDCSSIIGTGFNGG